MKWCPDEIEVREDNQYQDWCITPGIPFRTDLTSSRIYLCVKGYPDAHVLSYRIQQAPSGEYYLAAVKAHQAPEWGIWMPMLEEF
jgi:hypothetical protein